MDKREKLEELSKILLEREILLQHDLQEILGPRPFDKVIAEPAAVSNQSIADNSASEVSEPITQNPE
jgi:hypothetical protein